MGPNGELRVTLLLSMTNNANTKTVSWRFNSTAGAVAGGILNQVAMTNNASAQLHVIFRNQGATNSQMSYTSTTIPFGSTATAPLTNTIDTTQPSWVNIGIWPSVGTDTITLLGYTVELHQG